MRPLLCLSSSLLLVSVIGEVMPLDSADTDPCPGHEAGKDANTSLTTARRLASRLNPWESRNCNLQDCCQYCKGKESVTHCSLQSGRCYACSGTGCTYVASPPCAKDIQCDQRGDPTTSLKEYYKEMGDCSDEVAPPMCTPAKISTPAAPECEDKIEPICELHPECGWDNNLGVGGKCRVTLRLNPWESYGCLLQDCCGYCQGKGGATHCSTKSGRCFACTETNCNYVDSPECAPGTLCDRKGDLTTGNVKKHYKKLDTCTAVPDPPLCPTPDGVEPNQLQHVLSGAREGVAVFFVPSVVTFTSLVLTMLMDGAPVK